MRKSHAFYRVQLKVLMHARRSYSYVLLATFFHASEELPWKNVASNTTYLRALIRSARCAVNITKLSDHTN